jgi:MFS transporter, OPA family, sugar phosphate sensor protein UhpC
VNRLLAMLQPAPHIPEIKDEETVKKEYKYWRIRILYSMFIGYAFYYFTRKSLIFAIPGLTLELGLDKGQIGILGSILSITYGISKFASGVVCDRINPRYMMAFGLILTGIFNLLFGLSSSLIFFALFWGLNGWFQGFGWPPCARFLTQWYSHSERGSWWSTCSVSHNVGGFLIYWVAGISVQFLGVYLGGWRAAMFVPGILCIIAGFFLINRLRDTPQSLGLPPIDKYRNDYVDTLEAAGNKQETVKQVLMDILKNPYIWLLGVAYFFVYIVRQGVNDWIPLYLIEQKNYSIIGANGCASLFEVGGFFGALAAGWSSDYFFRAKRGPVNVLFSVGMFVAIAFFWFIPAGFAALDSILMFIIGFMIFGPQLLVGMAAVELSHKNAAATSNGFVGFFAYAGASFAGYPLGAVTQGMGWNGFFWSLVCCSAISTLLLLPLWNVTASTLRKTRKAEKNSNSDFGIQNSEEPVESVG